jgi:hypothetical protein
MNTGTSTTKKSTGFTDEEKAAMKARAQELKAEARASKDREEGEKAVLAAIAASTAFSPASLSLERRASAFNSFARALTAAFSWSVNPVDFFMVLLPVFMRISSTCKFYRLVI